MERSDVIILGAGAAGMFCAIEAGRRGRRVTVIDHARKPGEKIRISGGGRCNFTNLHIAPERFLSQNPRFALSALNRYTQHDFIARVDAAGIAWHEKTLGQLFCDGSAREIIAMLLDDMTGAGVELRLGTTVGSVSRGEDGFRVETSGGILSAPSLVIATGGKSVPKIGATGFGYRMAEQFGLRQVETRPALVPLTFTDGTREGMAALSGLSVEARVACGQASFDEGLLFTHRGLSGPSILQISSYWREGDAVVVDLATGRDTVADLRERRARHGRVSVKNALAEILPEKLAAAVTQRAGIDGRLADQTDAALRQLGAEVHQWRVVPAGSEGYRTAEVTFGGVDTRDLDARTMMARKVPGLFFVGEVVDVTGWLGGYNFQWAWSSGWAAGQAC
ncbi:NAD(P)/FAD-dependent oxidoreductase [Roseibacterium sp. SDUM158017]|uniref:NAD(P)/FAD-dependent oxidoreductase n=1 Tax=Roseicyclus salinarum TaxID=3036773 RepID=UPI002414ED7F|nr:NAD(P)/FAD-dependent oxidoreductase [Roseibacterium sp. SDUM158017]MDG4650332.1 NAD(P)/FAD-dependent oxidoreductase [Roseibacterium sp. SDUM158017]